MKRVVGIDPSLTGLAVSTAGALAEFKSEAKDWPDHTPVGRWERFSNLVSEVLEVVGEDPELIVIEGNQGRVQGPAIQLIEFAWHLKAALLAEYDSVRLIEVPPNTLKKWACGKGNADKSFVASALTRKYGVVFETNNMSDAYALLKFGEGLLGLETVTKAQEEIYIKQGLR